MAQNGSEVPVGLWFLAVPTGGKAQWFRTPYDAMAAVLSMDGAADVCTQYADGPRERLMHRDADGVWHSD
jgi:hypothetical protein